VPVDECRERLGEDVRQAEAAQLLRASGQNQPFLVVCIVDDLGVGNQHGFHRSLLPDRGGAVEGTIAATGLGGIAASGDLGAPLAELCGFLLAAMRGRKLSASGCSAARR
jgi:hypothetical protein